MNAALSAVAGKPVGTRRILVVDDDDAVREGLEHLLVTEGYEVVTTSNGIQALAVLRRQSCDLALIDINMPLLNGWGAIAELRRLNHSLPVIIITARPDQQTLSREAGVELMEKPLDIVELLTRIPILIDRSESAPPVS